MIPPDPRLAQPRRRRARQISSATESETPRPRSSPGVFVVPSAGDEEPPVPVQAGPVLVGLGTLDREPPFDDLDRPAEVAALERRWMGLEHQAAPRAQECMATGEVLLETLAGVSVVGVVVGERQH